MPDMFLLLSLQVFGRRVECRPRAALRGFRASWKGDEHEGSTRNRFAAEELPIT
jgi:hypothetical protein